MSPAGWGLLVGVMIFMAVALVALFHEQFRRQGDTRWFWGTTLVALVVCVVVIYAVVAYPGGVR